MKEETITVKLVIDGELRKAIASYIDTAMSMHYRRFVPPSGRSATDKEITEYVEAIWEADNDDVLSQYYDRLDEMKLKKDAAERKSAGEE